MPSVCIQAGHSAAYIPHDANGGGAPGEADWTARLAAMLAATLESAGVNVTLLGAWALDNSDAPPEAKADHDLFLSLHYDADLSATVPGYDTGCFAGRATLDPQGTEADAFIGIWTEQYAALGIPFHFERLNPNVTDYYAFRVTSAATPGVLIEHGVGMGKDHAILYDRIKDVADADAAAILEFLDVAPVPQDPLQECQDYAAALEQQVREISADRDRYIVALAQCNAIKQSFEAYLRDLEARKRIKRGTTDRLIREATA